LEGTGFYTLEVAAIARPACAPCPLLSTLEDASFPWFPRPAVPALVRQCPDVAFPPLHVVDCPLDGDDSLMEARMGMRATRGCSPHRLRAKREQYIYIYKCV
jgi:hypothetical protein